MLHAQRPSEPAAPVTWGEFVALPDDDRRELIDGALVEVEVPTFLHEWILSRLLGALYVWSAKHGGIVLGAGYKVRVGEAGAYMPDVQFYRSGKDFRRPGHEQGLSDGAPDLAVEIISPSSGRHDRVTKFNGYAAIGCPEYWLVDPQSRLFEQFVLDGEHYRLAARLADDAVFAPDTFPGLSLPLATLWELPAETAEPDADEDAETPDSSGG